MKEITTNQLYDIYINNSLINIIDVREYYEYNNGYILNSKNIPYEYLLKNYNKLLNYNIPYYIICEYGIMSKKACLFLSNLGYDVTNVSGGISRWKHKLHRKNF